jgi:Protein of unknown function (DUF3995)
MIIILGILESAIFIILSGIHFNWALGGKWGLDKTLPTNEKGEIVLNPKEKDSAVVGLGLLFFAFFYLVKVELIPFELPLWIMNYAGWIIAAIFILRAIGEFRYIGFFKQIRYTDFAKLDSKYYSPLCLFIGLIGIILELI